MLIVSDFDGTITHEDVTNCIWDHYLGPQWRDWLLPDYRAGRTSTLQVMAAGFKPIRAPLPEMLAIADRHRSLRQGFHRFQQLCAERNWPLWVVSCGLDVYIRAFLPAGVPFVSYRAVLGDGWQVSLPPGLQLNPGEDFKIHTLARLKERHPGLPVVFIGDGRNDAPIARCADRVFARRDSTLERLCSERGVPFTAFSTFHEIEAALIP